MQLRSITVSNVDESEKMPECDAYLRSKFWHIELLSVVFQSDVRSGSKPGENAKAINRDKRVTRSGPFHVPTSQAHSVL